MYFSISSNAVSDCEALFSCHSLSSNFLFATDIFKSIKNEINI